MPAVGVTGMTITPKRRTTDFGEGQFLPITPIPGAVFALDPPSSSTAAVGADDLGKPYAQAGSLFVPRGSDLKDGDQVAYQGKTYGIVGDALWDMDQPLEAAGQAHAIIGHYVEYALRLGG